jgi:hypothetical protein
MSCSCWLKSKCYGLRKVIKYPHFVLFNFITFICFMVCPYMRNCPVDGRVGAKSPQQPVLACSNKNLTRVSGTVRIAHTGTWFKSLWNILFSYWLFQSGNSKVHNVVKYLWCLIWNWSLLHTYALSSSLLFGCVESLCLLYVANSFHVLRDIFEDITRNTNDIMQRIGRITTI